MRAGLGWGGGSRPGKVRLSADLEEELNMLRKDSSLEEVQEPRGGNVQGTKSPKYLQCENVTR